MLYVYCSAAVCDNFVSEKCAAIQLVTTCELFRVIDNIVLKHLCALFVNTTTSWNCYHEMTCGKFGQVHRFHGVHLMTSSLRLSEGI